MNYIGQKIVQVLSEIRSMFNKLSSLEKKTEELKSDIERLEEISLRSEKSIIEIKNAMENIGNFNIQSDIKKSKQKIKEVMS